MHRAANDNEHERLGGYAKSHERLPTRDEDREHDGGGADAEPLVADVAAEEGQDGVRPRVNGVEEVVLEGAEVEDGGVGVCV